MSGLFRLLISKIVKTSATSGGVGGDVDHLQSKKQKQKQKKNQANPAKKNGSKKKSSAEQSATNAGGSGDGGDGNGSDDDVEAGGVGDDEPVNESDEVSMFGNASLTTLSPHTLTLPRICSRTRMRPPAALCFC